MGEQRNLPLLRVRCARRLIGVGHMCCMNQGRFPDKIFTFREIMNYTIGDQCQGCGCKILEAQVQGCTPGSSTKVQAFDRSLELDAHIAWCDERIAAHVRSDEHAKVAVQLHGVGPVTASA